MTQGRENQAGEQFRAPDEDVVFDANNLQPASGLTPLAPSPEPATPNVRLRLWSRDPKFTVLVNGRIPRDNTVLTQVSVPKDLHERLMRDSRGSLNQVLMGLVRYALEDLDAKQATLQISEAPKSHR